MDINNIVKNLDIKQMHEDFISMTQDEQCQALDTLVYVNHSLQDEHDRLRARVRELEEALQDIMDAHEATMREDCGTEKHCTCVPFYRAEIERLNEYAGAVKERDRYRKALEEIVSLVPNYIGPQRYDQARRIATEALKEED